MTTLEIQRALQARGYDPGLLDGQGGPRTTAALKAFQAAGRLPATGRADAATIAALAAAGAPKPAAPLPAPTLAAPGLITAERLRRFAPRGRADVVASIVEGAEAIRAAGISSALRTIHFLAQYATETGGLQHLEENLNYSAARLVQVWPARFPTLAVAGRFAHNPLLLAEMVYGGRLGNTEPGDGWRYRGGGGFQTTGRTNYREAGHEADPDALRTPSPALAAALVFWTKHGCAAFADRDDVAGLRRVINGGANGLAECRAYLKSARALFV